LKQKEAGLPVPELCREHGMRTASFYKWHASPMQCMKALGDENSRV